MQGNSKIKQNQEVQKNVKMLVSDLGNMVVGETIYISGGRGKFDIR